MYPALQGLISKYPGSGIERRTIDEWEIVILGTDTNSVCQEIALVPSDLQKLSTDVENRSC